MNSFSVRGNIVDPISNRIYPGEIIIKNERIKEIRQISEKFANYILPGLIDSHVHVESSMLTPSGFAEIAVRHGTVGVISDPHEIANVAGQSGIDYMIESGSSVPLKFFFGAPSCVPATIFESSGAEIGPEDIEVLLNRDEIYFLSEVMNFPGVVNREKNIMRKIKFAIKAEKPVDGHAPGLRGDDLKKYIEAGITTDHECVDMDEAEEKIGLGMKIQIREGSAAKGFDKFSRLIDRYPDMVMLCSDDIHPDDLIRGHINSLVSRGTKRGISIFNLLKAAVVNPVLHYNLPVGLLRPGDYADMIKVRSLKDMEVLETYINGEKVYGSGENSFKGIKKELKMRFRKEHISVRQLSVVAEGGIIRIIGARDRELFTDNREEKATIVGGCVVADPERDICKIVVVNKYADNEPSVGFISGFGLKRGAIAGSVSHDSHNIIAVGVNDDQIVDAVNTILDMGGGLAAVDSGVRIKLQLEIAGLMTNQSGKSVADRYRRIDEFAKDLGSGLTAPFMSLSFMSLLVIPELKLGDRGLFDVNDFSFTSLFVK